MATHYPIAIIGAGPGGLGAATNAASLGLNHILFEKDEIGNTIHNYQLKKHVMAEPAKLPLRSKINFKAGRREEVLSIWNAAVNELKVNHKKAEVTKVTKNNAIFEIEFKDPQGNISVCTAENVILAIGMQGSPRKLGVEGENYKHVAYTLSDPEAFNGRKIVVVGAGDAGIENALALTEKNSVTILNRGSDFPTAKDANISALQSAANSGKIKIIYEANIAKIEESAVNISTASNGELTVPCDHLIIRAGCIMPRKFLENCGIQFPNNNQNSFPLLSGTFESTVKGLYIVGALAGYPLIKQAINQGYEVVQQIIGKPVEPADQPLIVEKLKALPAETAVSLSFIKEKLPLIKDLTTPQYREFISESVIHVTKDNQLIFKLNDYGDSLFSVIEGSVSIKPPGKKEISVKEGGFFGEMGLLSGRRRSADVYSSGPAILIETPRKQILKLISTVDSIKNIVDGYFALRTLQSSIFPGADIDLLKSLVTQSIHKTYKKNQVIFKEGEPCDFVYIIRKGSVKISRINQQGVDTIQTYLPAGSLFGEMALLGSNNGKRNSTVTAAVGCELIAIDGATILNFLQKSPEARQFVQELAQSRAIENLIERQVNPVSDDRSRILDFLFSEGISDAENVLIIDSDLCVSCDNCETACAATHNGYSRLDRKGGKSFANLQVPISCRHCENPLCMTDCPPDALTRKPNGEVVIRDSCIGCGNCVRNCPYDVIQLVYDDKKYSLFNLFSWITGGSESDKGPAKAAKCDLCEGKKGGPACVRACPTGAAIRINPRKILDVVS